MEPANTKAVPQMSYKTVSFFSCQYIEKSDIYTFWREYYSEYQLLILLPWRRYCDVTCS